MITVIEYGQNLVKLLYFNTFAAIKFYCALIVLIRTQDAFTALPLRSQGNFDSICIYLHGYELFRTGLCSFELVAGGLGGGGQFQLGGWGWFRVVSSGLLFQQLRLRKSFISYVAREKLKFEENVCPLFPPDHDSLWLQFIGVSSIKLKYSAILTVQHIFCQALTAKNSAISPNSLVWKFCGKALFPYSSRRFARNYAKTAFPQSFHTKKLGEITVFFTVPDAVLNKRISINH